VYDISGPRPIELSRVVSPVYTIDADIKHPRTDEVSLSFERALRSDLRVAITGIRRTWKNALNSVLPNARWSPVNVANPLAIGTITAYRLTNPAEAVRNQLITNTDGFQYLDPAGQVLGRANSERAYTGVSLILSKRFNQRYQFQVSYVGSRAKDSGGNVVGGTNADRFLFESAATAIVNQYGNLGRPHELKLLGSYQVPVAEVVLAGYYRLLSGTRYTPTLQLANGVTNTNAAGMNAAAREIFLEPRGSRLTPNLSITDLRVEKILRWAGNGDIGLFLDVQNLLNAGTVTGIQSRVPSRVIVGFPNPVLFGDPTILTTGRQIQLGARWRF
jgi:hypothetical protein